MALGQIHSQSISSNENYASPAPRSAISLSKNVNRLLSALVVSSSFRRQLFADPVAALTAGYNGEKFQLTPAEYAAVTSLHVNTVSDFAAQLLRILPQAAVESAFFSTESQPDYPRSSPLIFN
jgi:hypothetical protein